jgi:ABC-2 type transport system permease protein
MNFRRVKTIILKEWDEVFRNRMVIFTIGLMPVMFTVLPLVVLYFLGTDSTMTSDLSSADVPAQFLNLCTGMTGMECMQVFMMNQFMIMFMMMPLIIPTAIAAYSIVGEKTTRSLEPLLATPITTTELLVGKAMAASIPAVLVTWVCFAVFLALVPLVGGTPALVRYIVGPTWLLAVLIIGPLMAVAAVNLAVIVSSRVNDPRVAEQMASVLIVPLMAVLFGQIAGLVVLNQTFMLISIVVILALDVALVIAGTRLFQRETILTRWK